MIGALVAGDLSSDPTERKGWRMLAHEVLSAYQARKRRSTEGGGNADQA